MRNSAGPLGAVVLAGVMAAGATGCSSDDGGSGSHLTRALRTLPASADREGVTYIDVPTARKLCAKDRKQYMVLCGLGIQELTELGYRGGSLKGDWGFDDKDVDTSLMVGNGSSRLAGKFDTETISRAMKKRGYRAATHDGDVSLRKSGATAVDVSGTVRVTHQSKSPKLTLTTPDRTLADDEAYATVSTCMGDAYEATFYGKRKTSHSVVLSGIGGRLADDGSSSEKLCALTSSRKAAEKTATALRKETEPGRAYAGTKVTVGGGDTPLVTMSWKNSREMSHRPMANNQTLSLPYAMIK
ncbi:hypothetical protein EOT10_29085 [Streptomyces antnestii]|uniref:Lipoprotein n=1 Tax=Streptomyces antnestii TaxID=2494256 RepID=A0A3S2VS18_9ACTN|nr:hypothetical protein [Streptomyces sp. San01]RVU19545.1 hypothetical protein EOT10_29085 [Streptomyces sp. San01]